MWHFHRSLHCTLLTFIGSKDLKFFLFSDNDVFEFLIVSLDNKQWHFEASSAEERDEWVQAIEQQILNSLQGNESSKSKAKTERLVDQAAITRLKSDITGNSRCVDCDSPSESTLGFELQSIL